MMPGLDGPSTLAALRSDARAASRIPVIFLTAKAMTSEVDRLRGLGACGVLTKPFDPMTLADQVRAHRSRDARGDSTGRLAQALRELRVEYVRPKSRPKLAYIVRLLEALPSDAADRDALQDLHAPLPRLRRLRHHLRLPAGQRPGHRGRAALLELLIARSRDPDAADPGALAGAAWPGSTPQFQYRPSATRCTRRLCRRPSAPSRGPDILVVDDDETVRDSANSTP